MSERNTLKDAIVIERIFDASPELIWQMWTDPEYFKKWYGPTGFTVPLADMELRVGGRRLICMASPDGSMKMWTVGQFTEIFPNVRLVYTESPADENGNIVSPADIGMPNGYPVETEVTIILEDLVKRTKMMMTHTGMPSDSGADGGWTQAFDKLSEFIKTHLADE